MPKTLRSLIRLYQFNVDEKRREVGGMIAVLNDLERQAGELEKKISEERAIAGASPEVAGILFGNYTAHYILKRERIVAAIKGMEEKLEIGQEEMRESYRDLKGVELTQDARENREALKQARSEQAVLDEIGIEVHRRASGH